MQRFVLLISGATATGKSDFALKIAQEISGEIINADVGSFYKPLNIGTAKPNWKKSPIRHHYFDFLDSPEQFTIVAFRNGVEKLIQEIWSRGNIPIVVGGSAFYIKSFFYQQHDIADTHLWIKQLEESSKTNLQMFEELHEIDKQRAVAIGRHDRYRLIRALAIFYATKQKPSLFSQQFKPLAPFCFIICQQDRDLLYKKIDGRVEMMMNDGWLEEVKLLLDSPWKSFLLKKKLIGYDDLLQYLDNKEQNLPETVAQIQKKTRNYAKRQMIFLNKLKREVETTSLQHDTKGFVQEINLTLCDVGLYIKGLSKQILTFFGK